MGGLVADNVRCSLYSHVCVPHVFALSVKLCSVAFCASDLNGLVMDSAVQMLSQTCHLFTES